MFEFDTMGKPDLSKFIRHIFLVTLIGIIIVNLSCQPSEKLEPPFDQIIPSCQDCQTTQSLSHEFTLTGDKGLYYIENKIIKVHLRSCEGEWVKLYMQIMEFGNDTDASEYMNRHLLELYQWSLEDEDFPTDKWWVKEELPAMIEHKPDQFFISGSNWQPSCIEEGTDFEKYGGFSESFYWRVGRYVGDYSVETRFHSVCTYVYWLQEMGGIGTYFSSDMYRAADMTIVRLREEGL